MKTKIQTKFGEVTITVDGGYVGEAEIGPDGAVCVSIFPPEKPPDDDVRYIGENPD